MDGDTNARIRLHLCDNGFGKDVMYQQWAGNDLCHYCDSKAEVNRMTHYAGPGFGVDN